MAIPLIDCKFPGIYRFTNLINGKIYVGQAQNIHERYKEHSRLKVNYLFGKALKKYTMLGFSFEVLERVADLVDLDKREQYWLDTLKPFGRNGYNVAPFASSCRGAKRTPEQVEAMRLRLIGRKLSPEHRAKVGRPIDPERRKFISRIHTGRWVRAIIRFDLDTGEIIDRWDSAHQASDKLGVSVSGIGNACRGYSSYKKNGKYVEKKSHAGYGWRYESEKDARNTPLKITSLESPKSLIKQIKQINKETGALIKVWDSAKEAQLEIGISAKCIKDACRGYKKCSANGKIYAVQSYAGFVWKYVDEFKGNLDQSNIVKGGDDNRVHQIDIITGNTVNIWDSAAHASKELGLYFGSIQAACRGRYWCNKTKKYNAKTSHGGFVWKYAINV